MRQTIWCGVLLCGIALQSATAQQGMGQQQMSTGQNQSVMAAILAPVTDAPYQAEKISRSVLKLGDGTLITHETRGLIARDAQGRIREDLNIVHSGQMDGKEHDLTLQSATVGDPVAHTILIWTDEKTKIAMQMQMPSLPKLGTGGVMGGVVGGMAPPPGMPKMALPNALMEDAPPPGGPKRIVAMGAPSRVNLASAPGAGPKDEVHTEELGQQSIDGILVTGKRTTTTIPLGKVGNDRPIVVVHEEWRSPELKILVKTIDNDPRTGEQTMELQNLTRTDPEAALFQAPPGYQVKDMADMIKGIGEIGRPKAQ